MVRRKVVHSQRVQVPSEQAMERSVAGPSQREGTQRPSGASRASERREQERGPQHKVKPATSSHLKCGSRAAHVTAKATSLADKSRIAAAEGPTGVGGAARVQGHARDAGDPTGQPESGQGRSYKPKVKARGVQRESEGIKVLKIPAKNNAGGGTGPCFGQASREGKREGMTYTNGSNFPGGNQSSEKVRGLQDTLYATAKRQQERRFHALHDRICRSDVLWEAWERVRRNRGAAGVDGITLVDVEEYGVDRMLSELRRDLQKGKYRAQAVLRRYIPKADGKKRPLGIPTVRDRVAQAAVRIVLEPIYEAGFKDSSYGFRPERKAVMAMERIRTLANKGYNHVLDADIKDYFGSIDQEMLMKLVRRRVSDRRVLKLLRGWLRAGVMEGGQRTETIMGTPQGGVISPLLSNIYLDYLDTIWERQCAKVGVLVRYADDFVVLCESPELVREAERRVRIIFERLKLTLHPEKTRKVDLSWGREGFNFLGWYLHKRMSGRLKELGKERFFLNRWPSVRSMKRVQQKVKELTGPHRNGVKDVRVLIDDLNPVLRGWGNYFRTGNSATKFSLVDEHVEKRLRHFLNRRYRRNLRPGQSARWTGDWFKTVGLHQLRGTIRYPGVVHAVA